MAKPVISTSSGSGSSTLPPADAPERKSRSLSLPSSSSIASAADGPPLMHPPPLTDKSHSARHPPFSMSSSDSDVEFVDFEDNDEFMPPLSAELPPNHSAALSLEKLCDGSCDDVDCKFRASASGAVHHSPPPSTDVLPTTSPVPKSMAGFGGLAVDSPPPLTSSSLISRPSTAVMDSSKSDPPSISSPISLQKPKNLEDVADDASALPRVLDFSNTDSSSTPSRPKPASTDAASPKTSTPSIEQEAKLSTIENIFEGLYRGWRYLRTIPGRLTSTGGSKVVGFGWNQAKGLGADKFADFLPDSKINTPLEKLRDSLFHLHEKRSTSVEIDDALRKSSITALNDFLLNQNKYFEETLDSSTGYPAVLTVAEQKQLRTLLGYLQKKQPISASFIKPLYDLIEKCYRSQLHIHKTKTTQSLLGIAPQPSSSATPPPSKKNRERRRLYAPPVQAPEKPIPKEDSIPLIITEIDQLKSLGFKIALALLILPESSLSKTGQENGGLLAELITKANTEFDPLKDSNELFQKFLFMKLDEIYKTNFVQRIWKKFTCKLLAPFILFMIEHVLDQGRDLALYLIGLTPEDRLNMIVDMFIQPSGEFFSRLHFEYISLSKNTKTVTKVDKAISRAIANIKIKDENDKDLTPKDLINGLVGSLIDRYAPSFDWRNAATEHFEKRSIQSKSPFVAAWFMVWSYLAWTAGLLFAPFRWCIHVTVRKILKMVAVSKIHSKLQDTTDSSWDFGSLALNSLYKTLYDKLQKRNRTERSTESQDRPKKLAIEQTAFVDHSVQDNINGLVIDFLELLYFQGSNLIRLRKILDPSNSVEQTIGLGRDYVYGHMAQKATEGIIHGLQVFLAEETFSAAICEVLQDIHQQCLHFNSSSSERNLARLEKDFYTELQDAVKRGIEDIIDEKLDPSALIQEEANLFVDGLKYDVEAFKKKSMAVPDFTPAAISNIVELRDKFLHDAFRRRTERAEKQTNASAKVHIGTIAEGFLTLRGPIYAGIDRLSKLASKKKSTEESVHELQQLISPLEKAISAEPLRQATLFYKELQLTLQKTRTKTYPPSVQTLISKLQGNFDVWTTESDKQVNQTHINGTINKLLATVQDSINEKLDQLEVLNEQITESHQETILRVNALSGWATKLQYFKCTTEAKEVSFIKEFLLQFAEEGLSPLILKQLDAFFLFLGKNHNIKGLLWYIIKSYLELPHKSPQEFKQIIDKVKSKLEAPPVNF